MTESQTFYELMCRAPAVPERFQPDMTAHAPNGIPDPTKWSSDEWYALQQAEKSLQWPSYYAREVLKRAEGGGLPQPQIPNAYYHNTAEAH